MAFVEVKDDGVDTHRSQNSHAANTEHDLLLDAHLLVATIEPGGEFPIPRSIHLIVGVHQIETYTPSPDIPDLEVDDAIADLNRNTKRRSTFIQGSANSDFFGVEAWIDRFLPPIGGDILAEVTHFVEEAHCDKWEPNIAGFLAMIASQYSQASRIDRQRLMQTKLSREVSNGPISQLRVLLWKPEVSVTQILIERHHHGIVLTEKERIAGPFFQLPWRHL